jgi:NAD(P)-dependent dehydrogenase (short-subunit alcohol dehydrogenase family)/acyl carrier protein
VDADQLLTYEPETAQRVFSSVIAGFESGAYTPLPCRVFKAEQVVDAFRLMQKSGHIGKIIVEAPATANASARKSKEFRACERGVHVVFGGTSGFGLEYARWLADHGARHIVLASRSGSVSAAAQSLAETLQLRSVSIERVDCDVTDKSAVAALLRRLRKARPIAGIAHTAMVLDDGLIKSLTPDRIEKVLAPKVAGARNLDLLTRKDSLDYFILFSSAAALFGNPGQASYVAADGYLDGLVRQRRAAGLKGLAVAWGAITDVGILARNNATAASLARHTGGIQFTAHDALNLLAQVLAHESYQESSPNIALAAINWNLAKDVLPIMNSPAYDLIRRDIEVRGDASAGGVDLRTAVQNLDDAAARKAVAEYLVKEVGAIFRMSPDDINPKKPLTDLGMDSLMGLELRMAVERQIGVDIMKVSMSDGTTIYDVADHIARRLREGTSDEEDVPAVQSEMLWQHVTEDIDASQLHALSERVRAREGDLRRLV